MIIRRIMPYIVQDLNRKKMVFISGPRQAGKTTLAKELPVPSAASEYYSWDIDTHRSLIRTLLLDESKDLWILDEIHKYSRWRNLLKGLYDLHKDRHKIVVTGSARLDLYSRGGDSLQGRYFHYRLHPLTLSEFLEESEADYRKSIVDYNFAFDAAKVNPKLNEMLTLGGFPEPLMSGSETFAGRWRLEYNKRLVREDVRTLEQTRDLDLMELLFERLPDLVSNNLSVNKLAKDLEVAHQTITKWIDIFQKLYGCFYVLPFGSSRIKGVKKEKKLYLWNWSNIEEPGARLENLVAVHLLRLVHWFEDVYGETLDLRYFKDTDGHEVDFIIMRKKQPWIAIEVKSSEQELNNGLTYFLKRIDVQLAYQIHLKSKVDARLPNVGKSKVRIMPVGKFLLGLP